MKSEKSVTSTQENWLHGGRNTIDTSSVYKLIALARRVYTSRLLMHIRFLRCLVHLHDNMSKIYLLCIFTLVDPFFFSKFQVFLLFRIKKHQREGERPPGTNYKNYQITQHSFISV